MEYPQRLAELKPEHRRRNHSAARDIRKALATPKWVDVAELQDIYDTARSLREALGLHVEVDHIIPIVHHNVCGLHVPWNLRIISKNLNRKKSNGLGDELENSSKKRVVRTPLRGGEPRRCVHGFVVPRQSLTGRADLCKDCAALTRIEIENEAQTAQVRQADLRGEFEELARKRRHHFRSFRRNIR